MASRTELNLAERLFQHARLLHGRVTKGMTIGVRAILLRQGEVLLVRHTYVPGWYFPGGGVDAGETVYEAVEREVCEEAGVRLAEPPRLFGIYRNAKADRRDHVALFVCPAWEQPVGANVPRLEIAACELFPVAALPPDATPATRARLAEVLHGQEPSRDW